MMFIEEKLYALLSELCPNVYQGAAPMNYGTPCVVLNRINTEPCRNIDDDLSDSAFVTFQITVFALRLLEAKTLSETIKTALRTWDDPDVAASYLTSRNFIDTTSDTRLHHVSSDYKIFCID